jgi:hypothetical protein
MSGSQWKRVRWVDGWFVLAAASCASDKICPTFGGPPLVVDKDSFECQKSTGV